VKPQGYVPPSASPSAHEASDLHVPLILRIAAVLGITLVASILVLALFFRHMERYYGLRTSEAEPEVTTSQLPPAPRLQMHPRHDLQEVRDVENSHLDRYGWIDRQHGVAQIPIERAMILWVKSYAATAPEVPPTAGSKPLAPVESALSVDPAEAAASTTHAAPISGVTELQMRQQKAQEAPHAP
jgi:hypothetical protein